MRAPSMLLKSACISIYKKFISGLRWDCGMFLKRLLQNSSKGLLDDSGMSMILVHLPYCQPIKSCFLKGRSLCLAFELPALHLYLARCCNVDTACVADIHCSSCFAPEMRRQWRVCHNGMFRVAPKPVQIRMANVLLWKLLMNQICLCANLEYYHY